MCGQVLLKELVCCDDVEVVVLCDIELIMFGCVVEMVVKVGKFVLKIYGQNGDVNVWKCLLEQCGLDGVIIVILWEYYVLMVIVVMQVKVVVGCEVVVGIILKDYWDVFKIQFDIGMLYMLLENVCYCCDVMVVLQMVCVGLFGELVYLQGGYQYDLCGVKFNFGDLFQFYDSGVEFGVKGWFEVCWCIEYFVQCNGEFYFSYGIGLCVMYIGINCGNCFIYINVFVSKVCGLYEYIVVKSGGIIYFSIKVVFKLGDIVIIMLVCENGEIILLQYDILLLCFYLMGFCVQGIKGLWMDVNQFIYIEGCSLLYKWELIQVYQDQYEYLLWKQYVVIVVSVGYGGMDWFVIYVFVEVFKVKVLMLIDIYDVIIWSVIILLFEQFIVNSFQILEFLDFIVGLWKQCKLIFVFDGIY